MGLQIFAKFGVWGAHILALFMMKTDPDILWRPGTSGRRSRTRVAQVEFWSQLAHT